MRLLHLGSFDFKVLSHLINQQLEIAVHLFGASDGNRTHVFSLEGCCTTIVLHSHPTLIHLKANQKTGGKGWIRTSELKRGQIYSLLALTTHPPFHKVCSDFKTKRRYYAVFLLLCQAFFCRIHFYGKYKSPFD